MKTLCSLLALVFLSASTLAIQSIDDIDTYKPCILDSTECPSDQICFQYFCYPKEADPQEPLTSCKKRSDCKDVEGSPKCFKQSRVGICVSEDDYEMCESHAECEDKGGKCCGDYCCNEVYFQALQDTPCDDYDEACEETKDTLGDIEVESLACTEDSACEDKHTGHTCCEDHELLLNVTLSIDTLNWNGDKRCCMSNDGIRQLHQIENFDNLTDADIDQIDENIYRHHDKRNLCKTLTNHLAEDVFQTCEEEKQLEIKEQAQAVALEIATKAADMAQKYAEEAENAKIAALEYAESAENASDTKGYNAFVADANLKIEEARVASEAANNQATIATDAGDAGDGGDAEERASAAATAAQMFYEEAKEALEGIEAPTTTTTTTHKPINTATCIKLSTISVISATILYSLVN